MITQNSSSSYQLKGLTQMFKTKFARYSIKAASSVLVPAAIALGVCLTPTTALADNSAVASPTVVAVGMNNLYVTVAGVGYEAYTSSAPAGCFTVSPDIFKAWLTLTQSALLAGKSVAFRFTDCGGIHALQSVDLRQ